MDPALRRAVLATVATLDAFEYPPTAPEVWQWLFAVDPCTAGPGSGEPFGLSLPVTPEQVAEVLAGLRHEQKLLTERDRWMLPGQERLVELHAERAGSGARKWRRVRTAAEFLRLVPYVEFVGVCNNLALDNAKPEADADLFLVLKDGHLWTGRALVTAVVRSLGYWRHGSNIADRLCLSFFVTEAAMDTAPLAKPVDPYLALWTAQVVPVLDRGGAFDRFRRANAWVESVLPNAFAHSRTEHRVPWTGPLPMVQGAYESFLALTGLGTVVESLARSRQRAHMEQNWWSRSKEAGTDVVISDLVLKFHESDRRELYRQAIAERVEKALR